MACRAHTGPVVCVEPSVIKGCYSAGRTEVKFVPLTQGIFQEVCLSDRVVRNVPARLWIFLINRDAGVTVFSIATLVCAATCLLVYLFLITRTPKERFIRPVKEFLHLIFFSHICSVHVFQRLKITGNTVGSVSLYCSLLEAVDTWKAHGWKKGEF